MAEQSASVPTLIREVVGDARQLVHDEILLARAEVKEQTSDAKAIGLLFGVSAVLALTGLVLLAVALGAAIADVFNWPTWAGFGSVATVSGIAAYVLLGQGRTKLSNLEILPRTRASVRENIAWIQSKSSGR
jgi:hypothetical protein